MVVVVTHQPPRRTAGDVQPSVARVDDSHCKAFRLPVEQLAVAAAVSTHSVPSCDRLPVAHVAVAAGSWASPGGVSAPSRVAVSASAHNSKPHSRQTRDPPTRLRRHRRLTTSPPPRNAEGCGAPRAGDRRTQHAGHEELHISSVSTPPPSLSSCIAGSRNRGESALISSLASVSAGPTRRRPHHGRTRLWLAAAAFGDGAAAGSVGSDQILNGLHGPAHLVVHHYLVSHLQGLGPLRGGLAHP